MIATTEGYLRTQEPDRLKQNEELAHTTSTEQVKENNDDAPTTSFRSRNEEELIQPSLELRNSPSPTPGPSNVRVTVAAPVLFARKSMQQDSNMPIQPKPPTKSPCGGEQDRQPPAKAGRDWTSASPSLQHRAATPSSDTSTPPGSPLPRPPPESSFVCAFCARPEHYTSDCPRHKRLSERVQLTIGKQICINCLKHASIASNRQLRSPRPL